MNRSKVPLDVEIHLSHVLLAKRSSFNMPCLDAQRAELCLLFSNEM
jgi:hypothetical protein